MIRIIVKTDGAAMAANIGGSVESKVKTFDVECPVVEAFLREKLPNPGYSHRQVIGIEILEES